MYTEIHLQPVSMFYTIRVFLPYAYGTYHTRTVKIRVWYRTLLPYNIDDFWLGVLKL